MFERHGVLDVLLQAKSPSVRLGENLVLTSQSSIPTERPSDPFSRIVSSSVRASSAMLRRETQPLNPSPGSHKSYVDANTKHKIRDRSSTRSLL